MTLLVPKVVGEGELFLPRIQVSQKVEEEEFWLFTTSGTAILSMDFEYINESVVLDSTASMFNTSSPVSITKDNLVEPDETFTIHIGLGRPMKNVIINNPSEVITIVDRNSECAYFYKSTLYDITCCV